MNTGHHVEIDFDYGYPAVTFVCDNPPGSDCRKVPVCDCGVWHSDDCIEKYPKGVPMRDLDHCNAKTWIDEAEVGESGSGTIRFAVTCDWDGEAYVWSVAE